MAPCSRCEVLPQKIEDARDFYLWFPLGHSESKVRKALADAGADWRTDGDTGAVVLSAAPGAFMSVARTLLERLSSEEVKATRVLPVAPAAQPGKRDYPVVVSLEQMLTFLESGWLIDAMGDNRFEVAFEPITFADTPEEIFAHRAGVRTDRGNGALIEGEELLYLAQKAGVLFQADRLARIAAIKAAAKAGIDTPIFVNFSPASIYDPTFCLRTTVEALEATSIEKDAVCFTIISPERWDDARHLQNILQFYRQSGFRVALGGVGSGATALSLIEALKPDVIFLDRSIVSSISTDAYKQVIARKLLEMAQRLRIETVVSGIGNKAELTWAYEHGANYVHGAFVAELTQGAHVTAA